MTTLAQRPCAEPAPATVELTGTYRMSAERVEESVAAEMFPAWSSLSWDERADYVARHCL